jgi:HEAT repeat protein
VLCLEVYYRYNPQARLAAGDPPVTLEVQPREPEQRGPTETPASRSSELRELAREKGIQAQTELIDALRDESSVVRSTALFELGKLRAAQAAPAVVRMLRESENEPLRLMIVDTLGRLGVRSVYPSLVRLLSDPEVPIQEAARSALSRLADGKDFGINKRAWQDWFERNP